MPKPSRSQIPYWMKLLDPRWQRKRLEILQRDGFACRDCHDDKSTLHVHHCVYADEPWETPNELLLTLCKDCHELRGPAEKEMLADMRRLMASLDSMAMLTLWDSIRAATAHQTQDPYIFSMTEYAELQSAHR